MLKGIYEKPVFFLIPCILILLGNCGLEDYPYIYPVPQSSITQEMNNRAVVYIPTTNAGNAAFSNFVIFYRIYVSDIPQASTTRDTYYAINPALSTDYSSIYPYIDSDTLVNTNLDNLFSNRGYKYLQLDGYDIDSVLSGTPGGILGRTIIFDFPASSASELPTMTIGSSVYTLLRSNGNGIFNPQPADRHFYNTEELWKSDSINAYTNADVVNKSSMSDGARYTYAAMFIAAMGLDDASYTFIYSTPSLIHVFQLPDR